MRPLIVFGVVLIVLGVLALAYQGITYATHEKVVDLGPVEVSAEKQHAIPLPPVLGAIAVIGGIVLVVVGGRKPSAGSVV